MTYNWMYVIECAIDSLKIILKGKRVTKCITKSCTLFMMSRHYVEILLARIFLCVIFQFTDIFFPAVVSNPIWTEQNNLLAFLLAKVQFTFLPYPPTSMTSWYNHDICNIWTMKEKYLIYNVWLVISIVFPLLSLE